MKLANKIAPGSTKIGQTSKPMSPKTELKQSIAGFQEREAALKNKITSHAGDAPKAGEGRFTKAEVLLQMFENTIKNTKSANTKKRFLNFIKEMKAKPELANDPEVWKFFTKGLPKNQRFVVHSDDTVDFWTQSKFGPHNIKTTDKFMQKHPNLSRDEAVRIQNMEPEDQILEMTKQERIYDKNLKQKNIDRIQKLRDKGFFNKASGGLAYMLGEPTYSDGGRIGFKKGSFDPSKRKFLKGAGAGLAALSTLPIVGKFFKWAKPAAKVLTKVPIESTGGMPVWFPKLVNKVVNEGTDVTKKLGTKEREIVHHAKVDEFEDVTVYRELDTGNVRVEYGSPEFDEAGKIIRASNDPGVVHLEYRAPEVVESGKYKGKKTKSEFSAAESEPEVVSWEGDIEKSGINEVGNVDELVTDTSKLKEFGKNKKLTHRDKVIAKKKNKYQKKLQEDTMEQIDYIEQKHGPFPDPSDYGGGKDEMVDVFEKYRGKASGGLAGLLGE